MKPASEPAHFWRGHEGSPGYGIGPFQEKVSRIQSLGARGNFEGWPQRYTEYGLSVAVARSLASPSMAPAWVG